MGRHYKQITEVELRSKLIAHQRYLGDKPDGVRLDLSNHNLRELGHIINGSDLALGDLSGTHCAHVNFNRCSVEGTNFTDANLRNAVFRSTTHLKAANWTGAATLGATFGPGRLPDAVVEGRVKANRARMQVKVARERVRRTTPVEFARKTVHISFTDWIRTNGKSTMTVDEEVISYSMLPKELFTCESGRDPRLKPREAVVWVRATRAKRERDAAPANSGLDMIDGVPVPPVH